MPRFLVAGVVTVTVSALVLIGIATQGNPPDPHVRLADRASTIATGQPGSNIEGIRSTLTPIVVREMVKQSMQAQVAAAEAEAERRAAEIAEEADSSPAQQPGPASSADYESPDGWTEWDWQAECETGGDWSMQGSSYSGGLGFANGSWDAYGGQEFASNAGMATREQQIIVAERIQDTPPVNGPGDECQGW